MCLSIITRDTWRARYPPLSQPDLEIPVSNVYCCYTGTFPCSTRRSCRAQVKKLQKFHIYMKNLRDIQYNFLLGGDGNVYEGRGWIYSARIEKDMSLNQNSVMVAIIGAYKDRQPPDNMFAMLDAFINHGIKNGFIKEDYKQHFAE